MTRATVRLTMAQALVRYLCNQFTEIDGERVPGGENAQLDMTPHYQKLLVGMYNDWLAKHRTAREIASLRAMAGVAEGQPIPLMRRGDHPAAPRYRKGGRTPETAARCRPPQSA